MYFNVDIKTLTASAFRNVVLHNHRKEKIDKPNIDYERSHSNYYLFGSDDENKVLRNHILETRNSRKLASGKIRKIRNDANVALSFVFSASPEFFFDFEKTKMTREIWNPLEISNSEREKNIINNVWKTLNKERVKEYEKIILEHMREIHGDNLINVMCHLDEKNVHFHCLVSPRVETDNGLKLSAKDYYRRASLNQWNKDIRSRMSKLGLSANKEVSDVPTTVSEHRENVAAQQEAKKELEQGLPPAVPRPPATKLKKQEYVFGVISYYKADDVEEHIKTALERTNALKKEVRSLRKKNTELIEEASQIRGVKNRYKKSQIENTKMRKKIQKIEEEQLENLRSIPVEEIFEDFGMMPKREGSTIRFKDENFNIVVTPDTNRFIDNKKMLGGYGAIDALTKVFKHSFREAVEYLSSKFSTQRVAKVILENKEETEKIIENIISTKKTQTMFMFLKV